MKALAKRFVIALLKARARRVLASGAKVIGVTGSIGKTTTKAAIAQVLQSKYRVLVAPEGFNTPLGLLLALLQEHESGFASPRKWLGILWRAWTTPLPTPEIIVLEYGVDHPGDMDELLRIARPDYAVLTMIAPVHLGPGQFSNLEAIAAEKIKLAASVPEHGKAILNFGNEYIKNAAKTLTIPLISYGSTSDLDFWVSDATQDASGIRFELATQTTRVEVKTPLYGLYHTTVLVPALIVGEIFGISLQSGAEILKNFLPPPGRGRILNGKNNSTIWDNSYNSSPEAAQAMLTTLAAIPAQRRLALIGNMNELGAASSEFHRELGTAAAEHADLIFFVGKEMDSFAKGVDAQRPLRVFPSAEAAGEAIAQVLQPGDLIAVKGSQNGVFLERAVKMLLATPEDAELLCRQGAEWERK